ncbi:MAG: bifunctional DNA-formamidopyrimidine glycosylase/DNA-(apurinic or apyrimidinic site) lyase [Planctomycetia bacterium]|nr:bifunctional DNA-formamidopyrimidine glycosylase/DNA-(apurinic or apyrimidinic site) lyase [Planctomycetia bacterium]
MPELPEVETMRRGLAGIVGRRVATLEFPRSRVRPISIAPRPTALAARVVGRTIAGAHRRGKRVVLELVTAASQRLWLVVEPRMTGLFLVGAPPSPEHVRMRIHLAGSGAPGSVLFWDRRGLGTIRLLDDRGLESACGSSVLGPDGLTVTGAELATALGRSRRAVKVALLDQRAVAGIGNIYAAEILFRAGIDPRTLCRRLAADDWERLADRTRTVLAEAVRLEGSSIGDETYRTTDNRPGRAQLRHRVYGRWDEPCRDCGTVVQRIVQAQRSTFFCPTCQVRPGALRRRGLATGARMP